MSLLEHWAPPPHHDPHWTIAWLLRLSLPVRLALLFAYWLYMGAAGIMSGLGVAGSLVGSALGLLIGVASYLGMVAARRREWEDEPREVMWHAIAVACGGLCALVAGILVVVPAIVVTVLGLWALASLPIWLFRK